MCVSQIVTNCDRKFFQRRHFREDFSGHKCWCSDRGAGAISGKNSITFLCRMHAYMQSVEKVIKCSVAMAFYIGKPTISDR